MVSTHLFDVLHLALVMRERIHLGTHSFRPKDSVVTQATDAHDTHLFSRTASVSLERGEYGQTSAHHGGSVTGLDLLGDGEHEALVSTNGSGIAALCDHAVRIFSILQAYIAIASTERYQKLG